jgi:FkbM family methyltransferase
MRPLSKFGPPFAQSEVESAMDREQTQSMKLFRLPNGLQVWNAPESEVDVRVLYREIFERHSYEKHGVVLNDGDVVFDVGANIGMFGLSMMRRFRDLQIYCFEPVPSTYACLARNLAESPQRTTHKVIALNIGLAAADGHATIEFFPGAPSNSTLYSFEKHRDFGKILDDVRLADMWRTNKLRALLLSPLFPFRKRLVGPVFERLMASGVSIPCEVRTLSGIIREYTVERIDLLKIDVEGAEMDVLAGIKEDQWPMIRQLSMEVDPANKHHVASLMDRLRSLGFARVAVESMFGGPSNLNDAVACTVFAVRGDSPASSGHFS